MQRAQIPIGWCKIVKIFVPCILHSLCKKSYKTLAAGAKFECARTGARKAHAMTTTQNIHAMPTSAFLKLHFKMLLIEIIIKQIHKKLHPAVSYAFLYKAFCFFVYFGFFGRVNSTLGVNKVNLSVLVFAYLPLVQVVCNITF